MMMRRLSLAVLISVVVACAPAPTSPPTPLLLGEVTPTQTRAPAPATVAPASTATSPPTPLLSGEGRRGEVTRVVVIGFDNYHLDDIQRKMPNLLSFMQKGAFSANAHHTDLPTRTAPNFATIASGQYPDRHGVVNNSMLISSPRAGFGYWENLVKRTPATFLSAPPWIAFNQSGWDIGAIGWQGLAFEDRDDVAAYLGRAATNADLDQYLGLAIHRKDGKAEIGAAEIASLKSEFASGWVNGWAGPPLKHAPITLRMATLMLASGVPIVFTYIENAHGDLTSGAYEDVLQADDAAFAKFISDLDKLGITPSNTLFIITTDEGDHYLANYARAIDISDLQPAIFGSAALLYSPDEDALVAKLASRNGVQYIATREAMKALHIATGADARTPTLIAFSDPESTFTRGAQQAARWNHGTLHPDITDIWLGMVGPGIRPGALTAFTDHADIVPTIRAMMNMPIDEDVDGVPIFPAMQRASDPDLLQMRELFKQLNAPLGKFGLSILKMSTQGLKETNPVIRVQANANIIVLAARRNAIIKDMRSALVGSEKLSSDQLRSLIQRGQALLNEVTPVNQTVPQNLPPAGG